ncbi:DNA-methyltransferase [Streptomyces sp. NPDC051636]|uniref:DNA-methyltransferase n=1 Tax=Streptomyces sp. NPDC051636 TaxID=3365663 RepID=UPI0037BBC9C5
MTAPALDLALTPPPGGEILHHTDRATIIWGDCRDPQIIGTVPNWYGLLCTDPPYGMRYNSGRSSTFTEIPGDDGSVDWPAVLGQWVGPEGTFNGGLAPSRHVYVFGYRPETLAGPLRLGGTTELVWDKLDIGSGDLTSPWGPGHEPITYGVHVKRASDRQKGAGNLSARLRRGSILRYQRPGRSAATRHSNEKPVPLMADLIESSTVRGDLVVDPCAGSGSTGVAAVLEGRRCFLVEINRADAELCVRRVKAAEAIADQMLAA